MGAPRVLSDIDTETKTAWCRRHQERVPVYWNKSTNRFGGTWKCSRCALDHVARTNIRPHGLTGEHAARVREFIGHCQICKVVKPVKSKSGLHVDHIHGTHILRGVLCSRCNNQVVPDLELLFDVDGVFHTELVFHLHKRYGEAVVNSAIAYLAGDHEQFTREMRNL